MHRYVLTLLFALVALVLAAGACGDKGETKKDEAPAAPEMSQEEAVIGKWQQGQHLLVLGADKSFRWEQPKACGAPPCPVTTLAGTFALRGGKILLDPREGDDQVIPFAVSFSPRTLKITASKKEWSLPYAGE